MKDELVCPICGGRKFKFDRLNNTYICLSCGYVMPGMTYLRSDPPFLSQESYSRTRTVSFEKKNKLQMIYSSKYYETAIEKYHNEMAKLFEEIQYKLPTIKKVDVKTAEKLLDIYMKKTEDKKHRWRKRVLAIALLVLATKLNNTQKIRLKKIEKIYAPENITVKDVRKAYREIVKTLSIKIPSRPKDKEIEILSRFRRRYGRDENVERLMKEIYEKVKSKKIGIGRTKKTVFAAIAYISYKIYEYDITQRESAKLAEITEIPLREMIKEILRKVQIEIYV